MPVRHLGNLAAALALALLLCPARSLAEEPDTLRLASLPSEPELLKLLWSRSPELVAARGRVEAARADALRTRPLPNPGLDLFINTIPLGAPNPPDLPNPILNTPNLSVGLSELIEIGKRAPRQQAARSALEAAAFDAADLLRRRSFDLLEVTGMIAGIEERVVALESLVADAARLSAIQKQRADKGDSAALDVDRSELEEEKLRSTLGEEREKLGAALLDCSRIAGASCEPFGDVARARDFVGTFARPPTVDELQPSIEARADVKSLERQEASAKSQLELAHQRRVPDPTVHLGYVRDQFVASGNQQNSLFVGVSISLPLFERGEADAVQASALLTAAQTSRALLLSQARRDLVRLVEQARVADARRTRMRERTVPLATGVVERLSAALAAGGASLQDVLLARRTLGELLVDAADLDVTAVRLAVAVKRTATAATTLPEDLSLREEGAAP